MRNASFMPQYIEISTCAPLCTVSYRCCLASYLLRSLCVGSRKLGTASLLLVREAMADAPKTRTLTREEVEQSANRLSTRYRAEVHLRPLVQQKTISQEEVAHSIKHLYDDSIAHRQQRLREIEQSANAEVEKFRARQKKLGADEVETMVHHLYEESIQRKQLKFQELYERELVSLQRTRKTLGKKEQEMVVARLYNEGMDNTRKKHIALFERFVLDRQPKPVYRSEGEVLAACDKLTRGEGVTSA
ncbi:uncharacterized protein Tco025E_00662 [Trypanosoma conorhini]|uniref:Uncharacterized protein n=1 Tax=Trypanosoma conorhini TaxID=83891 RepID=A0A3R7LH11_9TRYP|nr:uncharacterized protein Tco025E_00662 [Trypanosoma conorhini]RNF27108.1 hypothetical protein Tco025E_00662 [Trypanosoma conorhini]